MAAEHDGGHRIALRTFGRVYAYFIEVVIWPEVTSYQVAGFLHHLCTDCLEPGACHAAKSVTCTMSDQEMRQGNVQLFALLLNGAAVEERARPCTFASF